MSVGGHARRPKPHAGEEAMEEGELDEASVWDAGDSGSDRRNSRTSEGGSSQGEGPSDMIDSNASAGTHQGDPDGEVVQSAASPTGRDARSLPTSLRVGEAAKQSVPIPLARSPLEGALDPACAIEMSTSAPINIPLQRRGSKSRGQSPEHATSKTFIPPHLMSVASMGGPSRAVPGENDADMSMSLLKRSQLRMRRSVLQQTGFLDSS